MKVVDTGGEPGLANSSENFRKKIEMTLMLFLGAWWKVIIKILEKTRSKKSRDTVPLRE